MKVDVYRTADGNRHLYLPQGEPPSALSQRILDEMETLQFWKTVDAPENVSAEIKKKGYSLSGLRVVQDGPKGR